MYHQTLSFTSRSLRSSNSIWSALFRTFDCIQLSCQKVDDPIILNRQKLNLYYFNNGNGKLKHLYTPHHTYSFVIRRNTLFLIVSCLNLCSISVRKNLWAAVFYILDLHIFDLFIIFKYLLSDIVVKRHIIIWWHNDILTFLNKFFVLIAILIICTFIKQLQNRV